MKQTAVEWLEMQIGSKIADANIRISAVKFYDLINQAKEMEKEQHDKTAEEWWQEGACYMESGGKAKWESFEQYYNETFKSE